ncbi:MAG: hypothetical protein A2Y88_14875 [Chloroflexi bacterium RBG_13_48_10]|nr:MAG: hypothetical protein A2Y88_14875 [Chloroflexi bacterium RBG_13_48_10]
MKMKLLVLIPVIILLVISLPGCQSAVQTTQPPPAKIPPKNTPVPPSATPALSNTPEPVPSDTPILPAPTFTAQAERSVESMDELVGVWKGFWSNINLIMLEFSVNKQSSQSLTGGQFAGSEWYDFKDGMLTWGKMIKPMNAAPQCIDNPEATYQVFITYRGDQPEKLSFVLVGEDQCDDRQEFLDGNTLTWVGVEAP